MDYRDYDSALCRATRKKPLPRRACADCQDGEHENYDNNIGLVIVRDPDTRHIIRRAYMCEEHREMYLDDGYIITKLS